MRELTIAEHATLIMSLEFTQERYLALSRNAKLVSDSESANFWEERANKIIKLKDAVESKSLVFIEPEDKR